MSVTTFETQTENISEYELSIVPKVIEELKLIRRPRKSHEVCQIINDSLQLILMKHKVTPPRLRKLVNHIRVNGLLPVIATSEGYFVSYDRDVIEKQIKSLYERASSIKSCADGLTKFIGP